MFIDLSLKDVQRLLMMAEYCKHRQYKYEPSCRETVTKLKQAQLEHFKQFEHPDVFESEEVTDKEM